jgi:acetoin utilization deacetylase AcuC-like enzyme
VTREPPAPETLKVFYSEDMVSDAGVRASPSDRKPKIVSEALLGTHWPIELVAPEPTAIADVCRVHDPSFVDDVLLLRRPNGFGSLSESVARSVLYTCGACYGSSLVALHEGVSASLTSGFHHAGPRVVRGFCTFNGLMVTAAQLLAEARVQRIAIIDCDYHYGNGTQAIIDAQNLGDRVLHVSFGETFRQPEQALPYLASVAGLREKLAQFRPQLVLYQAGADTHVDDPLGGLLTTEQMRTRDRLLLTIARELGIPLSWNLAGGYQMETDGSIPRVVQLHLNTFEEALRVWQLI